MSLRSSNSRFLPNQLLQQAIANSNSEQVKCLLNSKADPNNISALTVALEVDKPNIKILQLLIDFGAKMTPLNLWKCLELKNKALLEFLISKIKKLQENVENGQISAQYKNSLLCRALRAAVKNNDIESVFKLLKIENISLGRLYPKVYQYLHQQNTQPELLLGTQGISDYITREEDGTVTIDNESLDQGLLVAVQKNNVEEVQQLLAYHANPNADPKQGLLKIALNQRPVNNKMLISLIKAGASLLKGSEPGFDYQLIKRLPADHLVQKCLKETYKPWIDDRGFENDPDTKSFQPPSSKAERKQIL